LEKVICHYVPNLASRNMSLLEGTLDLIRGPSEQRWVDDMKAKGVLVDVLGPGFTGIMAFNLTRKPLDDFKVRQAIAHAINRQEISDFFGRSIAPPQVSPVPSTWLFGIEEGVPPYEFDLAKAKKLLAEAGYANGFEIHNFVSEKSYYRNQMEVVQQQLKRIGITLKLTVVDHTTFHANQRKDLNALPIVGYGPDNDGGKVLNLFFHSLSVVGKQTANFNFSHYGDVVGTVDDFLDAAEGQPMAKQAELYAKAQIKVVSDLACYPTANVSQAFARQPYVDLGYNLEAQFGSYLVSPKTRILAH
jgi:peptide/nickel transport system substrate-binding protein